MIGENKSHLIDGLTDEGMPFEKYKNQICSFYLEYQLVDRFGWTLDYIRSMDYDDRKQYEYFIQGLIMGEKELHNG